MVFLFKERYIDLRTDFGFKRVFGTEANKKFTIDFLNTLLPSHHQILDLTFKKNESLGLSPLDRRAIFDVFCQGNNGEQFIVEMQRTPQAFYKDRSLFYATFPIQEQSTRGDWDYRLPVVYTVSVLDFVMDQAHLSDKTQADFIHQVQLKNVHGECFYDKLTLIYIELPKFKKSLEQLLSHTDKWLYLFRHLPEFVHPPQPLQEPLFNTLFEVAEIANFSSDEQDVYQAALKAHRDFNNVMNTAIQKATEEAAAKGLEQGREEGREEGKEEGREEQARSLILRQLSRRLGPLQEKAIAHINTLPLEALDTLGDALLDFQTLNDLNHWLEKSSGHPNESGGT